MQIKPEQLIDIYENALSTKPNNSTIYSKLAELYYAQGNLEAATKNYQQAVQIKPELELSNNILRRLMLAQTSNNDNDILYNWVTADTESLYEHSNACEQICKGNLGGVLIKQVFSKEEIENARTKIKAKQNKTNTTNSWETTGISLTNVDGDIERYFKESFIFSLQLKDIFANNFETRLLSIFNSISGSQKLELAKTNDENKFIPGQIRILYPKKGGYKAHNEYELFKYYKLHEHLKPIVKEFEILSYFLVIDKPKIGGELILYDFLHEQTTSGMRKNFYTNQLDAYLGNFRKQYINPDIGDMVIFNGGRIWHKVADFDGDKNRITVGGFLLSSQDNQKIYCVT